jgi:co-chaperonin GroES (HSP10)
MKPSKYLNTFQNVKDSQDIVIYGDALLVEKIVEENVKELGNGVKIYIAEAPTHKDSMATDKPVFVHVLAVGKGFYDGENDVPMSVEPGDIILVGQFSTKWFSTLEVEGYESYTIGLVRETEVQLRFKGLEAYNRYIGQLNRSIKEPVQQ